jgi:aminoglycoside phosphotransferase (APT) family kinase protein
MHLANDLANAQLIDSGLESDVYYINSHDGRELILKKSKLSGRQNYLFEACAYRSLRSLGARVPEVVRVNSEELLMTRLSGGVMDDQAELYDNDQLFADIAYNLALCNSVTFEGFGGAVQSGDSFVGEYPTWAAFLDTTEQLFEDPEIVGELGEAYIAKLRSTWKSQKPKMTLYQGALVHGDFAMSSLFVDGQSLTGVIDFGDAFIGDPLMDIAYFRFKEITKSYGYDIYRRLLRHYADARKLTLDSELEQKIVFYMIYWGLKRLEHCPDRELRKKFAAKLKIVGDL